MRCEEVVAHIGEVVKIVSNRCKNSGSRCQYGGFHSHDWREINFVYPRDAIIESRCQCLIRRDRHVLRKSLDS